MEAQYDKFLQQMLAAQPGPALDEFGQIADPGGYGYSGSRYDSFADLFDGTEIDTTPGGTGSGTGESTDGSSFGDAQGIDDEEGGSSVGGGSNGEEGQSQDEAESGEAFYAGGLVTPDRLKPSNDYADGGIVKGLLGKNPAGPDDGYGALDKGEYVVRADAVKHYGSDFFERLNDRKILKKSVRKLLG